MSAAVPVGPLASMTSFSTCVPAGSTTPVFVTVFHTFQPPVSGRTIGPVTSVPSTARYALPPAPSEATRRSRSYVTAVATVTEYVSHYPARTPFTA